METEDGRRSYRVDFVSVKPNPKQNRKAFTFAYGRTADEAAHRVIEGHPTETLEIVKVELVL
jgi:hypothetical protein